VSHTVKVKIEMKNTDALTRAAIALGGQVLGQGTHRLYSSQEDGFAIKLPGWQYPVIAKTDGTLAYDDYQGHWGNVRDIETLKSRYAIEAARLECERLGWYCEEQNNSLIVYHPDGGTLTIGESGEIDASGFSGSSCSDATSPLERALGKTTESVKKNEYWHEYAKIQCQE